MQALSLEETVEKNNLILPTKTSISICTNITVHKKWKNYHCLYENIFSSS